MVYFGNFHTNTGFPIDPGIPWWSVLDPGGSYWNILESLFGATISTRRARPVPPRCADTRACWMAVRSLDGVAQCSKVLLIDMGMGYDGVVHGCTWLYYVPSKSIQYLAHLLRRVSSVVLAWNCHGQRNRRNDSLLRSEGEHVGHAALR